MAAGDSGDVSAEVHVEVSGADQLRSAAQAAESASEALDQVGTSAEGASGPVQELAGELDELGDAGPGIEEDAAALGHLRDNAAEASPAVAALAAELDAVGDSGRRIQSGGLYQTLNELRDAMQEMERGSEMSIFRGGQGGWGIVPPSEQIEDELGNLVNSPAGPSSAAAIDAQMEDLEREMGTFQTSAAGYLRTVRGLESGIRGTGIAAGEAAMSLGGAGLGGSLDDLGGSVEDAWGAVNQLEGALFLGENAMSAVEDGTMGASVAFGVLAQSAADAEAAIGAAEGGGGLMGSLGALGGIGGELGGPVAGTLGGLINPGMIALIGGIGSLIGGAISVATPLAAGAAGFAGMGAPAIYKLYEAWQAVDAAKQKYQSAQSTYANDKTKANLTAEKTALAQLKGAYQSIPSDLRPAYTAIQGVISEWEKASRQSGIQRDVLRDIPKAADDVKNAIPAISSLGQSFAPLVSHGLGDLGKFEKSAGFKTFISDLDKDMPPAAHAVRELGDAIGGIVNDLTQPGAVKDASEMFSALSSGIKSISPGAVDELKQAEKALTGIGNAMHDSRNPKSGWHQLGRYWDDAGDAVRNVSNWTRDANKIGGDFIRGFLNWGKGGIGGGPGEFSSKFFANLSGSGATSAAEKAGSQTGLSYAEGLKKALAGQAASGTSTSAGLQKSMDDAARNVKLHGVTVDLADSKPSGLTALQGTLDKAGTDAGRDYDTALGRAIASDTGPVTASVSALARDIERAMAPMHADGITAGNALGSGLAAGIEASTSAAVAAATRMADEVTAAVRAAHQTASPSKLFRRIGRDDVDGLVLGLEDGALRMDQVIKALDPTKGLTRLIRKAEDFGKSVASAAEQGAQIGTLYGETRAGVYQAQEQPHVYSNLAGAMRASLHQIRDFDRDVKELHKRGLSQALIRQLLQEGPAAGLPQAEQMLSGGRAYIRELDKLEKEITRSSQRLGASGAQDVFGRRYEHALEQGLARAFKSQRIEVHVTAAPVVVKIDGKEIARVNQTYTLRRASRNLSSGLKLANRGA